MKTLLYSLLIVVGLAFSVKAQQASSNIMITEFQYRAVSGNTDSLEFVEFMNTTNEAVDISGAKLFYGTTLKHTFPANTVLSPYQIVVVAHFPAVLQREYNMTNTPVGINGTTTGMSNSGATIYLRSASNDVLDQVTYTTSFGNLTGKTVEFCDLTLDNANANASSNWAHSTTPVLRTDNSHNNYVGQLMYGTPGYLAQNCQWPQSQANPCDGITVSGTVTGCGADASVVGAGGTPAYTYEWSNSATTATVNNLVVGEGYTVTIEDANGCTGIVNYVPVACVVDPAEQLNDECTSATVLSIGTQCTPVEGNLLDATESMSGCTGWGDANDLWYSFVATTNNLLISVTTEEDVVLEIFEGSCGDLTSIECVDYDIVNEVYSSSDFILGETYFVRVYAYDFEDLITGDFTICVQEIVAPENDECVDAIVLSVGESCTPTTGNLHGATESMEGCAGYNDANDVWYSFVATSNAHIINVATEIDVVLEVFNGACGTMESLACIDEGYYGESYNSSAFVIGQTYFVRIYGYFPDELGTGEFTVCVLGLEPPSNDECEGAIVLSVGQECTPIVGNLLGATESLEGCAGYNVANDVWYSFVATSSILEIRVETQEDVVLQVFEGTCGNLDDMICVDDNYENENYASTEFVVGQTYFVRVYAYDYNDLIDGDFTICVQGFTPVENNDCGTATTLVSSTTCTPVLGTLVNATISQLEDDCNPNGNRDVWYSFVAQATNTTITVEGLDWIDPIISVYTGACGSLTQVSCEDDEGGEIEELELSNLTVGSTYFIRVTDYYGGYEGSTEFSICVTHVAPADPCAGVTITGTVTGCGAEAEVQLMEEQVHMRLIGRTERLQLR